MKSFIVVYTKICSETKDVMIKGSLCYQCIDSGKFYSPRSKKVMNWIKSFEGSLFEIECNNSFAKW